MGPELNQLRSTQEMVRHMALKRKENIAPDKKRDKKWLILTLVLILAVCGGLMVVPFLGDILVWVLNLL